MKSYFILSAVGKDRPGIVADVSEVIYNGGGNIEDSSMSLLRNHFALLLLFSTGTEEVRKRLLKALSALQDKDLTVFYSPVTLENVHPIPESRGERFEITTSGVDQSGIVFRVCRLLASAGINIIDMETRRVISAESGTPLFEMDIQIEVPPPVSEQGLREDLHQLANELLIDLVLKRKS